MIIWIKWKVVEHLDFRPWRNVERPSVAEEEAKFTFWFYVRRPFLGPLFGTAAKLKSRVLWRAIAFSETLSIMRIELPAFFFYRT
jgi:hypothetical protein